MILLIHISNATHLCSWLIDILEVCRPVGVTPVTPSTVPLFRGFGPCPRRPSSEGFLATLTPWGTIVIFFVYWFFSEEFCNGVIQIRTPSGGPPTEKSKQDYPSCHTPKADLPRRDSYKRTPARLPWRTMRLNLMMTGPSGILVSLNPTEEALWERPKSLTADFGEEQDVPYEVSRQRELSFATCE